MGEIKRGCKEWFVEGVAYWSYMSINIYILHPEVERVAHDRCLHFLDVLKKEFECGVLEASRKQIRINIAQLANAGTISSPRWNCDVCVGLQELLTY